VRLTWAVLPAGWGLTHKQACSPKNPLWLRVATIVEGPTVLLSGLDRPLFLVACVSWRHFPRSQVNWVPGALARNCPHPTPGRAIWSSACHP
jgi:hypothetical protein